MVDKQTKKRLRQEFQQRRDVLDQRAARSQAICIRVMRLPIYQQATRIHCYLPIKSEVDTFPLVTAALDGGKTIVVPVVQGETLLHVRLDSLAEQNIHRGVFGVWQPRMLHQVEHGAWDMVIVPMVAFDRAGYRLGYGKGFYDRMLATLPTTMPTVGVAFAAQEAAVIPREGHDVALPTIVTEYEVVIAR